MARTLTGDEATFALSGTNPTITVGTTADFDRWEAVFDKEVSRTRPFGWTLPKVTVGGKKARGRVYGEVLLGTTPPYGTSGTAAYGTLTLKLDASHSYAFKAVLTGLQMGPNSSEGGKQRFSYEFEASGESNTDDVTVT